MSLASNEEIGCGCLFVAVAIIFDIALTIAQYSFIAWLIVKVAKALGIGG